MFPLAVQQDKANKFCQNWLNSEAQLPSLPRIADDFQPCPCTLDQALLDIGLQHVQQKPYRKLFTQKGFDSLYSNGSSWVRYLLIKAQIIVQATWSD